MNREPLITTAVIAAIIAGVLTLLRAFGVPITEEQQDAINQLMVIVAPLVVAGVGRVFVTPVSNPRNDAGQMLVPLKPNRRAGE